MASGRTPERAEPTCLFPDEAEIARIVLGPARAKAWPGSPPCLSGGACRASIRNSADATGQRSRHF